MNIKLTVAGLCTALPLALAWPAPAAPVIELNDVSVQHPRVIRGGTTQVGAIVKNGAPAPGQPEDVLNYRIAFQPPVGDAFTSDREMLAPQQSQPWAANWNTANHPLGVSQFNVTVTDDDGVLPPVGKFIGSHLLKPAGIIFVTKVGDRPAVIGPPIEEPIISPEQFAATGYGETFAAAAPQVIGDSPGIAANNSLLNFDAVIDEFGSDRITADFTFATDLRARDDLESLLPSLDFENPSPEILETFAPFRITLAPSPVGTYSKTWVFGFSDELLVAGHPAFGYLPGASGFATREVEYSITFHVVPEAPSVVLLGLGGLATFLRRRDFQDGFK